MSRLKVMLRGALISEIELKPEKEYIGGRKEGCDIRLQAEKGISREHFKLKFTDGRWQISAVSRFGDVFSLGQKIETADLQHGQSFQVPPYEFTLLDVPDAAVSEEVNAEAPMIGENEKTVIGAAPQVPYVKMVNSSGEISEMLRLEFGEVWVAGRDPSCQIIIPDQRVSRRQFEIYKVNGAYTILDLASVNGTFLNGSPVSSTDPQTLKSGDAITVLDNTMYFELHDPNFRYKVDKIEVPPLQVDLPEEEDVVEENPETEIMGGGGVDDIPQIDQYDVPQQIVPAEGPFTGMPGAEGDQANQYYNFQAPPPAQEPPAPTGFQKFLQNKPLLIAVVIAILGGAYYVSEMMQPPPVTAPVAQTKAPVDDADPFSKLTPAQQKEVEEYYTLAEQMLAQQKYDLALEKIRKIKEILPKGYKDSDQIEFNAEQANLTLVQQQKDDEAKKAAEELLAKKNENLKKCEQLLGPDITSDQMQQCLRPVAEMDPNDSTYLSLMEKAEKIESDRKKKAEEEQDHEQKVAQLQALFADAEKMHAQGYAFKTIKKYQTVLDTDLPDPGNLKAIARDRILFIQQKIREKSESSIAKADAFFKEGKLRDSVLTLREALVYDPGNKSIQEKIDLYSVELKRQVKLIYQEAVIDENYGMLDDNEAGKKGAKNKWKTITEMDLEDGEYYKKAVTKLRRYGVY